MSEAARILAELLDTKQVAELRRCTPNAIVQAVKRGKGPPVYGRGARGLLLFRASDVDAWLADPLSVGIEMVIDVCRSYQGDDRVYLIADPSGFLKIGTSRNPEQRFVEIQTGNPRELELVTVVHGDRDIETLMHNVFAEYRVRGEWFRDVPEIRDAFWEIKRG